jgi:phosphate transport system protein
MARETLDRKLRHLLDEVLVINSLVEAALVDSVGALKKRDLDLARQVYAGDRQINARRFELETDIIITIATTQPVMAGDLRLVASILEVVGELERIGDYAKGIAHIALLLGDQPAVKPLVDIPRMLEIALDMLHRAVSAFVSHDVEAARQIPREDDQVDYLYNQVYRELVAIMFSDPSTIDRANYLMWVAHNLERVADRVTNICERTIYTATGQLMEFEPLDDETITSTQAG